MASSDLGHPVWFVRHGESTANAARTLAGHHDVDLTPRGEAQARALAGPLGHLQPARLLASDLRRAVRTARLAWPHERPALEIVAELRERDMGAWERRPVADLSPEQRAHLVSWEGGPPGGESQAMLARRVLSWLAIHHKGIPTVLFVHGGLIRCVVGLIDDIPTDRIGTIKVPNAVILSRTVHRSRWNRLLAHT